MKYLVLAFAIFLPTSGFAAGNGQDQTPTIAPNQLAHFPFDTNQQKSKPPVIRDLSIGQQFIMSKDRKEVKALVARHLGILDIRGDKSDLSTIQQLVDRNVLKADQVREWQAVGVVFGDILANEFNLHWVSYQDDRGVSTALRWKNTQNFVFPVTMLSRRVQFNEKIDVTAIYQKVSKDIREFIAYEDKRPKF